MSDDELASSPLTRMPRTLRDCRLPEERLLVESRRLMGELSRLATNLLRLEGAHPSLHEQRLKAERVARKAGFRYIRRRALVIRARMYSGLLYQED